MLIFIAAMFLFLLLAVTPSPTTALLFGLLVLSYLNYLVGGRDVLYPAFTFTAIWAIVAALYRLFPIEIDSLGWKTVLIFLGGSTSFSLGALIGNRPLIRKKSEVREEEKSKLPDNPMARISLLGYTVFADSCSC